MSVFNENISIKIKDVCFMSWKKSHVDVAPRSVHALVYRKKGCASFICNKEKAETHEGDVFYMPQGVSYSADYGEYNEVYVIHFESDSASSMENFASDRDEGIEFLFKKAEQIWQKKEEGYYYSAVSIFGEIVGKLAKNMSEGSFGSYPESFVDACRVMEASFKSPELSVEKLAATAHISTTYFRRLFSLKYGTTPVKYINSLRLAHAERLLAEGRHSVEEVAYLSGFNDAKYFSRQIKKQYGVPPSKLYKFK